MKLMCEAMRDVKKEIKELREQMSYNHSNLPCKLQMEKCDEKFEGLDQKIAKRVKHSLITILLMIFAGVMGFNFTMDGQQWTAIGQVKSQVEEIKGDMKAHDEFAEGWMYRIKRLERYHDEAP